MQTPEGFRRFDELLHPPEQAPIVVAPLERAQTPQTEPPACEHEAGALREMRLFRARVADALDAALKQLLTDIAADVLARELTCKPADIERIVQRALDRFADEQPVRVRAHPLDVSALHFEVPVQSDETLRRGDTVIELRCGYIDASLGARLQTVLEGFGD